MGIGEIGKHSSILITCEAGLDRSAAMKIELVINRGYKNVLNCGIDSVDKSTFEMLADWADLIIVPADSSVWNKIPWSAKGRAIFEDIGKDIWHSPDNPKLKIIVKEIADKLGL